MPYGLSRCCGAADSLPCSVLAQQYQSTSLRGLVCCEYSYYCATNIRRQLSWPRTADVQCQTGTAGLVCEDLALTSKDSWFNHNLHITHKRVQQVEQPCAVAWPFPLPLRAGRIALCWHKPKLSHQLSFGQKGWKVCRKCNITNMQTIGVWDCTAGCFSASNTISVIIQFANPILADLGPIMPRSKPVVPAVLCRLAQTVTLAACCTHRTNSSYLQQCCKLSALEALLLHPGRSLTMSSEGTLAAAMSTVICSVCCTVLASHAADSPSTS